MGGAILKLNFRSPLLMRFGNATKSILPYMWLYKMLAFIIMPNRNRKESRVVYSEAKTVPKEFIRWFKLTSSYSFIEIFSSKTDYSPDALRHGIKIICFYCG